MCTRLTACIFLSFAIYLMECSISKSEDIENHKNYKLLPKDCGTSYADRIIGGKNAALGQYPWLARVGYELPNCTKKILFRCGGALINDLYVLTAAHCTTGLPKIRCPRTGKDVTFALKTIALGELDTTKDPDCDANMCAAPIQKIELERVIVHQHFQSPPFKNDISLIRLKKKVDLNGWVAPICLPRGEQLSNFYVGKMMEVAGWGATNVTDPKESKMLMFVKLPTVEAVQCSHLFNVDVDIDETTQMCVGGELNHDSCAGDSGGPLMYVEAYNGPPRYYELGLVSFGVKKCGQKGKPAIYTRVAGFINWILDNISP